MNLLDLVIAPAYAQTAAQPGGFGMSLLFTILLICEMYYLKIRPQIPPGFWCRHYGCG